MRVKKHNYCKFVCAGLLAVGFVGQAVADDCPSGVTQATQTASDQLAFLKVSGFCCSCWGLRNQTISGTINKISGGSLAGADLSGATVSGSTDFVNVKCDSSTKFPSSSGWKCSGDYFVIKS